VNTVRYAYLAPIADGGFQQVAAATAPENYALRAPLDDYGTFVALEAPDLQGRTLQVDVKWDAQEWGCVPTLSVEGALPRRYPVEALRGSELCPPEVVAGNADVYFSVTPTAEAGAATTDLVPLDDEPAPGSLWVRVPDLPTGPPVTGAARRLGPRYHDPDDVELVVSWDALRAIAIDKGARLRDGEAFVEEAWLSVSTMHRTEEGGLVQVVRDLLPAMHTPATASSLCLTAPTWKLHEGALARAREALGCKTSALTWLHDHHMRYVGVAMPGADRPDGGDLSGPSAAESATREPDREPMSGLFFSSADRAVLKATFAGPAGCGIVLDSAQAERIRCPEPGDLEQLFAVFGWRRGRVVRRSAAVVG